MTTSEFEKLLKKEDPTREYKVDSIEIIKYELQDLDKVTELLNIGVSMEDIKAINPTKMAYLGMAIYTINGTMFNTYLHNLVESEELAISKLISAIKSNLNFI